MAMENFSRYGGGAESYAVGLAQTLVSEGWEVHLYGHSWDGQPAEAVFHSIPKLPRWVPPSIRILSFAFRHRTMIAAEEFDVVLGFGNTLVMNVYQSHGGVHFISNIRKLQAIRNPLARWLKFACSACDTEIPRKSVDRIRAFQKKPTTCHHSYFGYGQE